MRLVRRLLCDARERYARLCGGCCAAPAGGTRGLCGGWCASPGAGAGRGTRWSLCDARWWCGRGGCWGLQLVVLGARGFRAVGAAAVVLRPLVVRAGCAVAVKCAGFMMLAPGSAAVDSSGVGGLCPATSSGLRCSSCSSCRPQRRKRSSSHRRRSHRHSSRRGLRSVWH